MFDEKGDEVHDLIEANSSQPLWTLEAARETVFGLAQKTADTRDIILFLAK